MNPRGLYVVGDSNVGSLQNALNRPDLYPKNVRQYQIRIAANGNVVQSFVLDLADGNTILNPAIEGLFAPTQGLAPTFWRDNHVVLLFGSVEAARFSLLVRGHEFRLHGQEGDCPAISVALAESVFEHVFAMLARGLSIIAKLSMQDFYMLEGPPPVADNLLITKWFEDRKKLRPKVASPSFRRLAFELSGTVLRRLVERNGGVFIPAPPEAFHDGMLRPDLFIDPYHASAEYGALALAQIERHIKKAAQCSSLSLPK